jgi:hypothetical protein
MAAAAAALSLRVGDVVVVGRACMGNRAGARAVVIEEYRLAPGPTSWSLLFENGSHDGFPPSDLDFFLVEAVGHEPTLAGYQFTHALRLWQDWSAGRFDVVWREVPA